jgi:hypothetical protein
MRILSIASIAAAALLANGLVSEASAQGRGRGQDKNRARGIARACQVASANSRLLRTDGSRFGIRDDSDSDSDGKFKNKNKQKGKNKHCTDNGNVIGKTGSRLPSSVCIDANGDGFCDSGSADQRRPRSRTGSGAGGVILGRRTPGNILVQQLGMSLLQRYAQQHALASQQRATYGQRGIR